MPRPHCPLGIERLPLKYRHEPHSLPTTPFGDCFPRRPAVAASTGSGYAVQMLDTDTLLDRITRAIFCRSVRRIAPGACSTALTMPAPRRLPGLKPLPAAGGTSAGHRPAGFDDFLQRHVLIYGVLCGQP
jgi:hypothetical protein